MTFSTDITVTTTIPTTSSLPGMTATALTTATEVVDASSIVTSCTTFWEYYDTTITATRGQTIAFSTPSSSTPPPPAIPTTKIFPTYQPTVTSTTTETQFAIYFQSPSQTTVYSTWTVPLTSYPPQVIATNPAGQLLYVVDPEQDGWDSWSKGEKAGLIIGVIAAAVLLALLFLCCCKRLHNNEWIAHDWRHARNVESGPSPGANVVPTMQVNGPLDPRLATPYGYGYGYGQQGNPGWGWMRGGDGEEGFWRKFDGRLRFWRKKDDDLIEEIDEEEMYVMSKKEQPLREVKPETLRWINDTAVPKTPAFYKPPVSRIGSRPALFEKDIV